MNQTKLPEGWEAIYERWDGSQVVLDDSDGQDVWLAFLDRRPDDPFPLMVGGYPNAESAMLALNEKYPLEEKEDGEG